MALSKEYIRKARKKAGGSNVGKYKGVKSFAGPSGGAPKGSYPINSIKRAKSALKLAHNAPNPSGIKSAVYRKYPSLKKAYGGFTRKKEVNPYSFGGILGDVGGGAMSGLSVGGPIGAAIGGGIGLLKGIFGHKAEKAQERAQAELQRKEELALKESELAGMVASGGQLRKPNQFAFGGLQRDDELQTIDVGGTHEQNPQGGIQFGIGENGLPNTMEEGETAFNIGGEKGEKFIFSNRIPYNNDNKSMPSFIRGDTIADASKSIEKAFFERNDKYSNDTRKDLLKRLAYNQEQIKKATEETQNTAFQNQFQDGGPVPLLSNLPATSVNRFGEEPYKYEELLGSAMNPNLQGATKDSAWFDLKDKSKAEKLALGIGYGTQLAGVMSNVLASRKLKQPEKVPAHLVTDEFKENLVNRDAIIRNIARTEGTSIEALKQRAGGDFGALAANIGGIQAATGKAVSNAMLQSEMLDAQEKARVQQGRFMTKQFNVRSQSAADIANAQNVAQYEAQKAAYSQGIAANIGSLGQSLINYVTATKFSKYKADAMKALAFANA